MEIRFRTRKKCEKEHKNTYRIKQTEVQFIQLKFSRNL